MKKPEAVVIPDAAIVEVTDWTDGDRKGGLSTWGKQSEADHATISAGLYQSSIYGWDDPYTEYKVERHHVLTVWLDQPGTSPEGRFFGHVLVTWTTEPTEQELAAKAVLDRFWELRTFGKVPEFQRLLDKIFPGEAVLTDELTTTLVRGDKAAELVQSLMAMGFQDIARKIDPQLSEINSQTIWAWADGAINDTDLGFPVNPSPAYRPLTQDFYWLLRAMQAHPCILGYGT